ncbi:hypothetical protein ACRAKI_33390 [Saccharothrix isguenensis]
MRPSELFPIGVQARDVLGGRAGAPFHADVAGVADQVPGRSDGGSLKRWHSRG